MAFNAWNVRWIIHKVSQVIGLCEKFNIKALRTGVAGMAQPFFIMDIEIASNDDSAVILVMESERLSKLLKVMFLSRFGLLYKKQKWRMCFLSLNLT